MSPFSYYLTNALVIALSIVLLIHLVAIAIFKEVIIKEPRTPVLWFEIVMMVVITGFATYNCIVLLKEGI